MSNRELSPLTKDLMFGRARIAKRRNWCKGEAHRDATIFHPEQWCAYGALRTWEFDAPAQQALAQAARKLFGHINAAYGDPKMVNDCLGHAAVLAMYDEAIRSSMEGCDALYRIINDDPVPHEPSVGAGSRDTVAAEG